MNKKQMKVLDFIKNGFNIGKRGDNWIACKKSVSSFVKYQKETLSSKDCDKMVSEGTIARSGVFLGPCGNEFERFSLKE
jgi:hypothetical protein